VTLTARPATDGAEQRTEIGDLVRDDAHLREQAERERHGDRPEVRAAEDRARVARAGGCGSRRRRRIAVGTQAEDGRAAMEPGDDGRQEHRQHHDDGHADAGLEPEPRDQEQQQRDHHHAAAGGAVEGEADREGRGAARTTARR